jgi:serine/threonine-protein phosphatase PPG1
MAPFDLDACIQQLLHKQLLHEALLREICEKTKEVLMRESNVVHVSAPVTVVGDIHGCARFSNPIILRLGDPRSFFSKTVL